MIKGCVSKDKAGKLNPNIVKVKQKQQSMAVLVVRVFL
jgi:hypothetical protein